MSGSSWRDAASHRRDVRGVTFIGVTGSCGKTTTVRLTAHVLAGSYAGTASAEDANCGGGLAATVLAVTPTDRFCVQELGAWGPGTLDASLAVVRPEVGVVTNVRRDHLSAFRTLEATQQEKSKLIAALPSDGTAILNVDDPRVAAMAELTSAQVVTFGRTASAAVRASNVGARWPDRLSFDVANRGRTERVQTRLLGEEGLGSALAAIAIGTALGVPLDAIASRLATAEPPSRRMTATTLPDGVTFVRDDFKAPSDSLGASLDFLREADAARTIFVVGRISDYGGRSRPTYTAFAEQATRDVDELVFVGERAHELWGSGQTPWTARPARARVSVFRTVEEASRWLQPELRRGDLVLLKASGPADHLERLLLDRTVGVTCWLPDCGLVVGCDDCPHLTAAAS